MKIIIWLVSLFILLIIQSGILEPVNIFPVNLLLILVVVAVLFAEFNFSFLLAVAAGIFLDFASGTADGLISLAIISAFLVLYALVNFAFSREPNLVILFAAVGFSTLCYFGFFLIFNALFGFAGLSAQINLREFWVNDFLKSLGFNLLLTYPVLMYYNLTKFLSTKLTKNARRSI